MFGRRKEGGKVGRKERGEGKKEGEERGKRKEGEGRAGRGEMTNSLWLASQDARAHHKSVKLGREEPGCCSDDGLCSCPALRHRNEDTRLSAVFPHPGP